MLVLSRKIGERVAIGNDIVVTVVQINRDRIRLGFDCPLELRVLRDELRGREEIGLPRAVVSEPGPHRLCTCSML
jgi:carbon storage regulator CsrA